MEARRNRTAPPPPPPGIWQRLRRFLADTFSPSVQLEEDKRVPVIIHGRLVEVQGEEPPESGSMKTTAPKKSVTIKEKREEIQVEAIKKTAPSKRESKESHPPAKLSKAISDINQRAMDFIKRKRQVLGRSLTVLNNPKDESST